MQHIIIGSGPAGVVAAETLRKASPRSSIALIGDEPEPPYSRMAIPYYLVNKVDEAGTYLRKTEGYFDSRSIDVIQDRVTGVDSVNKSVKLASGGSRSFDKLLIASGSTAVKPPIEGISLPGVHNCWTLEDARKIIQLAKPGSSVVLMGAGFIGCIILEALASRDVQLTVVEMENRMVPRMMNEHSGGLIKRWCESKGVKVLTSTKVTAINQDADGRLNVCMGMGNSIMADLVISATGVKPNTGFLSDSGIEIDNGIVVDHRLRTSQPDIFAAGDVARGKDFSTKQYSVQAIQPTAVEHGRIAAMNMVSGQEIVHQGSLNMNVLDTMGLVSVSFGDWDGSTATDTTELYDQENYKYINLQFRGDVLVGANALGMIQYVGLLRGLIQTGLSLGAKSKQSLMDNPLNIAEAYLRAAQSSSLS